MKFSVNMVLDLSDSFQDRKPDIDMLNRYLSARIRQGEVIEDNLRGRVVMNIKKVQAGVMAIE